MSKLFIYNLNGEIYESTEAFDATSRAMHRRAAETGEPFSRQEVKDGKIINQHDCNGIWLDD